RSATCRPAARSTRAAPIALIRARRRRRPTTSRGRSRPRSAICTIRNPAFESLRPARACRRAQSAIRNLMALVEVSHLVKRFTGDGRFLRAGAQIAAVDDVSFTIEEGETFGLVGESGSGKTTTGRCLLRLVEPTSGDVRFRGENVLAFSGARLRRARREMQIVFQDPYSSLNPRMRARQIVE